jgi:glycosyltransferase involved in cell wall biosynthesis
LSKVYFFSRYGSYAASYRLRFESVAQKINLPDYDIVVSPLFKSDYLSFSGFVYKPFLFVYFLLSYIKRIFLLLKLSVNDIAFIQYELFPFVPPFFESYLNKKGVKLIFDFDDAFFHSYDDFKGNFYFNALRKKYAYTIGIADHVITGSPYLSSFALRLTSAVTEIPTCVATLTDTAVSETVQDNLFTIGWIGSSSTSKYIDLIEKPLNEFLRAYSSRLILIGYSGAAFQNQHNVQLIDWSENNEHLYLPKINVGIMPLTDDKWSRGKCGFKLIQYMSYGKPTISTPLEANKKIDDSSGNLFAISETEWFDALLSVYQNADVYRLVGSININRVAQNYLLDVVVPKYESIFKNCLNVQN